MRSAALGFLASSMVVAGCGGASSPSVSRAAPAPAPVDTAPHVVLVSIDGMRPDYYTKADSYGLRIPALRSIMARGRYAEGMTSVFPTVTFPAHTTMVTGTNPATHGISTNLAFDPWFTNAGGWNWYAESIRGESLWTAARKAGMTTGAIFWPVTVGAPLDFNVPQFWRERVDEDMLLLRAVSSPGFATELEQHASFPTEIRSDKERGDAAAYLVREKKPSLALLYFADLDTVQHRSGPASPEAFATLEAIDVQLGRIVQATVDAHTYDTTTFLVVSDHGFLPVTTETRPSAWLAHARLIVRDPNSGRVTGWQAAALPAGGSCGIVLRDPKDPLLLAQVDEVLTRLAADPANGIARVVGKPELARRGGFGEASFALEAARGFELVPGLDDPPVRPSGHKGTHGYPPEIPEMRASFLAAGPGIPPGPPIPNVRMIDVAPTVARILHLSLPHAEGKPIDEIFASARDHLAGNATQVAAMATIAPLASPGGHP